MTLILGIVKPGDGAWYSVDNRVTMGGTVKNDDARKQIYLRCRDGAGVLLYTGLAALYPAISRWRTTSGRRCVVTIGRSRTTPPSFVIA